MAPKSHIALEPGVKVAVQMPPEPTEADGVEVTVEFVMHVANILAYLGAGDSDA